jgi:hypothetical protein
MTNCATWPNQTFVASAVRPLNPPKRVRSFVRRSTWLERPGRRFKTLGPPRGLAQNESGRSFREVVSKVALVVAIVALVLAAYAAVASRSSDEQHRCGSVEIGLVSCVSDDTPRHIEGRSCYPSQRLQV